MECSYQARPQDEECGGTVNLGCTGDRQGTWKDLDAQAMPTPSEIRITPGWPGHWDLLELLR